MWHGADDYAAWDVEVGKEATFDIWLDWACADAVAGNAWVLEGGRRPLRGKARGTGGWDRYRQQPDPSSREEWYRQSFNFLDVDGKPVSVTVRDTVEQMRNIVYDRPALVAAEPARNVKEAPAERSETLVQKPAILTDKPVSLAPVEVNGEAKALPARGEEATAHALLEFEVGGLSYSGRFSVRVFVNKPDAPTEQLIELAFPEVTIAADAKLMVFEFWTTNVVTPPAAIAYVWSIEITYN